MNNADTLRAGIQASICNVALALALTEVEAQFDAARNRAEMDALRATPPICGKPGRGFKAWRKKWNELRDEEECIYNRNIGHAIHDYTSANNLTFYPSDLRDGRHHEIRRGAQEARDEEMRRAREFAEANYTPADDEIGIADAVNLVLAERHV